MIPFLNRISVFVDGNNLFHLQKSSLRWQIDVKKILQWVSERGQVVDATYYTGIDAENQGLAGYLDVVSRLGYTIESKPVKTITQENGDTMSKANMDVEMAVDMISTLDRYDTALLVSGDGDFLSVLQALKHRGKGFILLSTYGMVAREIRQFAGMHYVDFQDIRSNVEKTI